MCPTPRPRLIGSRLREAETIAKAFPQEVPPEEWATEVLISYHETTLLSNRKAVSTERRGGGGNQEEIIGGGNRS